MSSVSDYIDTGVDWIGKIPREWSLKPLFSVASENKNKNGDNSETVLSLSYGKIKLRDLSKNKGILPDNFDSYQVVSDGYIIIRSTDLQNDKKSLRVGLVTQDGIITSAYLGLIPHESLNSAYFYHYLHASDIQKVFYGLGGGVRQSLGFEDFKRYPVPLPSLEEQSEIVKYLDRKLSQIDLLIEKTQRKIELLKEQQTATINHYVTKGLDPTVKMKDSGIEWIGEIPEHWGVVKLKYLVEIIAGRDPSSIYDDDGKYDVLGTGGVIGKTNEFMCDQTSLIVGRKGTIDKPFIQKIPFWISDVVYYILPTSYISPTYYWYLFSQIDFNFYKYGSTMPSMSRDDYENMKFPIPPIEDLIKIELTLNSHFETIKKIIIKNEKRIDLLKEYRQSLISNVVTGKVRVTEEVI